jgi:ribA/ribD-fused uncharacterized protein
MNTIAFTKVSLPDGWLGNMAPYPVECEGMRYRTTEALFQCLRFAGHPAVQSDIREQKSPMAAKMIARKYRHLLGRQNWDEAESDIPLMRLCLQLKVQQHPGLKTRLLDTGEAPIIEDCTARPRGSAKFWGAVLEDGRWNGRNVLGSLWMELREQLKTETSVAWQRQ